MGAKASYERALRICERVFGSDHPSTKIAGMTKESWVDEAGPNLRYQKRRPAPDPRLGELRYVSPDSRDKS
jgi:hypothetical protein